MVTQWFCFHLLRDGGTAFQNAGSLGLTRVNMIGCCFPNVRDSRVMHEVALIGQLT